MRFAVSKSILMIVGDFVEDYEAMVPYQMLTMVGHNVSVVSPGKKPGEKVSTAIHDFEGDQTYSEKRGHNFQITGDFETTRGEDFDALVIPGGRAPEFLRLNKAVLSLVQHFFESKKPVAAICHGAQILSAAGVLSGRVCMAYPAVQPEVELAGARFAAPNATASDCVVDDNLVTAAAWPAHPAWMKAFLDLLGTKITCQGSL